MAVLINNWTTGKPLTAIGNTGAQSVRLIPACRVFIKAAESTTAAPINSYTAYAFKTLGSVPSGWTDLGTMEGAGKVTLTKNKKKIQTGIDKVTRQVYIDEKSCEIDFSLTQFDDTVLAALGFNSSVITAGSTVNFQIGQEDIVQKALLLVCANKLDGKEIHWYHPSAQLDVSFDDSNDGYLVKVNAELTAFTGLGQTVESLVSTTVFA